MVLVNQPIPHPGVDLRELLGKDAAAKLEQYANMLIDLGIPRGVIGPAEADQIWDRHILNCAVLDQVLPRQGKILDLGSGAGLPGIVLAILRPEQEVVLLDTLKRRVDWLELVSKELNLTNTVTVWGRAEEQLDIQSQAVVSRAVASLTKLLGWSRNLVSSGGAIYALKGRSVFDEIDAVPSKEKKFWIWPPQVQELQIAPALEPTNVLTLSRK
jgi:16S rRNA (guanine527-N7)-methyltransferase